MPCEVGLVLKILTTLQTTQGYLRRSSIESTRDSIRKEKNAAPHESAGDSKSSEKGEHVKYYETVGGRNIF